MVLATVPLAFAQMPSAESLLNGPAEVKIAFSGNGLRLAISLEPGTLHLYRRKESRWVHYGRLPVHTTRENLTWSDDGSTIGWTTTDWHVVAWRPAKSGPRAISVPSGPSSFALSSNGSWFACTTLTGLLCWGRSNANLSGRKDLPGGFNHPYCIQFVSDSDLIVTGPALTRYEFATGKSRQLTEVPEYVAASCLDPTKRHLGLLTWGQNIEIRSVATGRVERTIPRGKGYPVSLTWSGDGKYVACELCANHKVNDPNWYSRLQVFRFSTGRRVAHRPLEDAAIGDISFEPGCTILFLSSNSTFWDRWGFSDSRR